VSWDLSKLRQCAIHGHHAGSECPLCEATPSLPAVAAPPVEEPAADRSSWWAGLESELHDHFATWLEHHEIEFVHSRTDQKSTIESGWEDFTCIKTGYDGITRACLVELKNRTGKLRKDQVEVIARHRGRNLPVLVTGDFLEACDFVKANLGIQSPS
jgi:hypothetical protein